MRLDDRPGDGEAETYAVGVPGGVLAATEEGLEDLLPLRGRDAVAGVGDLDLDPVPPRIGLGGQRVVTELGADLDSLRSGLWLVVKPNGQAA